MVDKCQSDKVLRNIYFFTFLTSLISDSFRNIWFTSRLVFSCTSAFALSINRFTGEYSINATFVTKSYRLCLWFSLPALTQSFFEINIELLLNCLSWWCCIFLCLRSFVCWLSIKCDLRFVTNAPILKNLYFLFFNKLVKKIFICGGVKRGRK